MKFNFKAAFTLAIVATEKVCVAHEVLLIDIDQTFSVATIAHVNAALKFNFIIVASLQKQV
jgi:hypothetical protein